MSFEKEKGYFDVEFTRLNVESLTLYLIYLQYMKPYTQTPTILMRYGMQSFYILGRGWIEH